MSNNRNKIIIMMGLLVFFFVLLITFIVSGNRLTSSMWILYSIIILVAVLSVATVVIMNRTLHKRISTLPKDYQDVFVNIQDLLGILSKNFKTRKEILDIIVEIFEHAALEKRDVREVINNDVEGFVKEFLVDKKQKYSIGYTLLYSTSLYLFFILFMKLYKVLRADSISIDNFKTETLDVGITLTYLIIAFVFYPLLMYAIHYSAKKQLDSFKRLIVIIPLLIPILLMFALIFIENENLRVFLDTPIELFPNIYTFSIGIVLLLITSTITIYSKE